MILTLNISMVRIFRRLWKLLLEDQLEQGAEILASEKNLDEFQRIAQGYMDGSADGVVLIYYDLEIGPVGVLMWGEAAFPFETKFPKLANGWGTWVDPRVRKKGVSKALSQDGQKRLREKGFTHLYGSAMVSNTAGIERARAQGYVEHSRVAVLDLGV
jgi:GNAT superfamily N-acetyltransferase